jgi:hypothetical protein
MPSESNIGLGWRTSNRINGGAVQTELGRIEVAKPPLLQVGSNKYHIIDIIQLKRKLE